VGRVSEIWSTTPITVEGRLPRLGGGGWRQDGPQHASYLGPGWLITIEPLREEDWLWGEVPVAVRRVLPQAHACLLVGLQDVRLIRQPTAIVGEFGQRLVIAAPRNVDEF
jgi:hypothetical protein